MRKTVGGILIFLMFIFALVTKADAFNGLNGLSIGINGGGFITTADEAIEDEPSSDFDDGAVYGGHVGYTFPGGFTLKMSIQHFETDLGLDIEEEGVSVGAEIGTLKMTPLVFLLGYQGVPNNGTGFGWHVDAGGGIAFVDFDKSSLMSKGEDLLDVELSINTDNAAIFMIGCGLDYFFTRNISVNLDGRFLVGIVDADVELYDPELEESISETNEFNPTNFQILAGISYWF